jgi:hypothetical protein
LPAAGALASGEIEPWRGMKGLDFSSLSAPLAQHDSQALQNVVR